jgi:hypothetical protein
LHDVRGDGDFIREDAKLHLAAGDGVDRENVARSEQPRLALVLHFGVLDALGNLAGLELSARGREGVDEGDRLFPLGGIWRTASDAFSGRHVLRRDAAVDDPKPPFLDEDGGDGDHRDDRGGEEISIALAEQAGARDDVQSRGGRERDSDRVGSAGPREVKPEAEQREGHDEERDTPREVPRTVAPRAAARERDVAEVFALVFFVTARAGLGRREDGAAGRVAIGVGCFHGAKCNEHARTE